MSTFQGIKVFSTQAEAESHMNEEKHQVIFKCKDFQKGPYGSVKTHKDLEKLIINTKPEERVILEIIRKDLPLKLCADIDGPKENTNHSLYEIFMTVRELLKSAFANLGMKYKAKYERLLFTKNERISLRYIYYDETYVFKNPIEHKTFWEYVISICQSDEKYSSKLEYLKEIKSGKHEMQCMIDHAFFSNGRINRCPLTFKKDLSLVFRPCEPDYEKKEMVEKKKYELCDYFCHVTASEYEEEELIDYKFKYPKYEYRSTKQCINQVKVDEIIKSIPNTKLRKIVGNRYELQTIGKRHCIINDNCVNEEDNSVLLIFNNQIIYLCHGCEKRKVMHQISEFEEVKYKPFDPMDTYVWTTFKKYYAKNNRFDSEDQLYKTVIPNFNRVVACVEQGKGYYVKKDTQFGNQSMNIVKKSDLQKDDLSFLVMCQDDLDSKPKMKTYSFKKFLSGSLKYITLYPTINFDPELPPDTTEIFNMWRGFKAVPLPDDKKVDEDVIKPMLQVMMNLCENDPITYKSKISWLWYQLVCPWLKTGISFVMFGEDQGVGKNTLTDFLCKWIYGDTVSHNFSNLSDLTDKFNGSLNGVKFAVVNEATSSPEDFRREMAKLKDLITGGTIDINQKGKEKFPIKNVVEIIINSQHMTSLSVEESDRRLICCEVKPNSSFTPEFWADLRQKIFNNEGASHFLTYFKRMNKDEIIPYEKFRLGNFQNKTKLDMIKLSLPTPKKFLLEYTRNLIDAKMKFQLCRDQKNRDAYIKELLRCESECDDIDTRYNQMNESDKENALKITSISATDLYSKYRYWCNLNGEKATNNTLFGTIIRNRIEKFRTSKGMAYNLTTIDFKKLNHDDGCSDEPAKPAKQELKLETKPESTSQTTKAKSQKPAS